MYNELEAKSMNTFLFSNTPTVTVLDNRGLTVRNIAYHRHPDSSDDTRVRIIRHHYDVRGFLTQSADPRLHETGLANFSYLTDLAGSVLRTVSVDAGTTVSLNDAAGRPFLVVSNISSTRDGMDDRSLAVTRTWQYEDAALSGRLLSITEQLTGEAARITERFVYAGNSSEEKARNLTGQCVSHYDTVGLIQTDSVTLTGAPLSATRRLLKDADNPDTVADWKGGDATAWNDLLTGESEGHTTLTTADATGAVLTTTDAKGNMQRVAYDVAGLLSGCWLTLKGGTEQVIVKSLTYSAAGQKLREEHGNGVVTTYTYEAETQRLAGIKTARPAGHASRAKVLQDLRYKYDPVGNVLKITNDAEETRFWHNQKVVPENTYVYDSLYQLVRTTGREMATAGRQGSNIPSATVPFPVDSSAFTNYSRTYTYDTGGNLTQISHNTPATGNSYTTKITISDRSNRGMLSVLTENPAEVDALFTAGGQQKQLLPGQHLIWTTRDELLKVTPVVRDGCAEDSESYRYDGGSQRILKVSVQSTGSSTQTQRVLYLPGLELRSIKTGDTETEGLEVVTVGEAGRAQVRVLHWESGKPEDISNDQLRWSYDNQIGSGQLELDGDGQVISMEEYYPYGGTAVWAARSQLEADYKTIRYSGKERDATGLYYYGYRYYQPWAGRWLSADPAGTVDGLNLYGFCRGNPVGWRDEKGKNRENAVLDIVRLYAGPISELNSFDSLSRELSEGYSKNEKSFILRFVLGENLGTIRSLPQDRYYEYIKKIAGNSLAKLDISDSRLKELCEQDFPRLLDIYERNEDVTHYESLLFNSLSEEYPHLSGDSLREKIFQKPEYWDILRRANLANCRECSNAIAGLISKNHPSLSVATVSSGNHDHQYVLVGNILPNRFDNLDDLEPDIVLVDPWVGKGNYQIAKDAFMRSDAFSLGYVWQALKYETIFFDPLSESSPVMQDADISARARPVNSKSSRQILHS